MYYSFMLQNEYYKAHINSYLLRLHGSPLLRAIGAPSAGVFLFP